MAKILMFGGSGLIGSHLYAALKSLGHKVFIQSRSDTFDIKLDPFDKNKIWYSEIYNYEKLIKDPQVIHNKDIETFKTESGENISLITHPVKYDGNTPKIKILPQNIGAQTKEILKDLNYTEEAIKFYKKSLSINSEILETNLNIAFCFQSLGNYDDSIYHLSESLKIDPKSTISDRLISTMKKYKKDDVHLNEMIVKIDKLKLNDEQLSNLHFGL